jgi:hypothetical protein
MFDFFTVVNGRTPLRLNILRLSEELQRFLTKLFRDQAKTMKSKNRTDFSGSYRAEFGEVLTIANYTLPELYRNIPQASKEGFVKFSFTTNTATREKDRRVSLKAIFAVNSNADNPCYYFQSLTSSKVLYQRNLMLFSGETFCHSSDNALIPDTKLAAIYEDRELMFTSYHAISPFLDIAEYFHEATKEEIKEVLEDSLFTCDEATKQTILENSDEWMRKRFAGLRTLLPEIRKNKPGSIAAKARNYKLNIKLTDQHIRKGETKKVIVFPKETEDVKKLLAFLNEEMYTGELTGKQYKSNSQIQI